jgi:hypothetical protein
MFTGMADGGRPDAASVTRAVTMDVSAIETQQRVKPDAELANLRCLRSLLPT